MEKYIPSIIILIICSIVSSYMKTASFKGYQGEREIKRAFKRLRNKEFKVIHNLLLKSDNGTSQIDHVVISQYGIFVIETKNYMGVILGNEFSKTWTQTSRGYKGKFQNPIKQNYGHIKVLEEHLKEHENIEFISIIAFTIRAKLKVETSTIVTYTNKVINEIKKFNNKILTDSEVDEIYKTLISSNLDSVKNRKEHIKNVKKKVAN